MGVTRRAIRALTTAERLTAIRRRLTGTGALSAALVLAALLAPAAAAPAASSTAPPPTPGALYHDGQSGRYLLGGKWLYRPDPADRGESQSWFKNVASTGWSPATVPNSFNAGSYTDASWNGTVAWYRRDFTLPQHAFAPYVPVSARSWIVRFESINYRATVWLNGHLLGAHTGPNLPFEFDLNRLVRGVNRLVVRVDNRRVPGELPPDPGDGWWNFGGILREVYLRAVQRADIAQVHVQTLVHCSGCAATIHEQALIRNPTGSAQSVRLSGSYGTARLSFGKALIAAHRSWLAQATVRVSHPRLWWPGHAALYRNTVTLADTGNRRLASYLLQSGIRTVKVTGGRLTINGRTVHLRGVDLREQELFHGSALSTADQDQLVQWVRELGATVIRSDPLNPLIYELADRYGLLIWNDVPVTRARQVPEALSLIRQNIADNQQHPSILSWNIANELPIPTSTAEAKYISTAVALAHRLDPGRLVSMAILDWPGVACQPAYAPLDLIGVNEYFGWYDAGGGATDDCDALSPFLDSFRACYPRQGLFVSEFGFDGSRNGPVEERGTLAFQADSVAFHLGVFATKPVALGRHLLSAPRRGLTARLRRR